MKVYSKNGKHYMVGTKAEVADVIVKNASLHLLNKDSGLLKACLRIKTILDAMMSLSMSLDHDTTNIAAQHLVEKAEPEIKHALSLAWEGAKTNEEPVTT